MNANIDEQFERMGARLKVRSLPVGRWGTRDYAIDIQRDRHGEFFELRVPETIRNDVEVTVLQSQPRERHLLLLVRKSHPQKQLDRFLCGHDEREWFVAAVPGVASSVSQAMEALKPEEVLAAQAEQCVTASQRNRRKNRAFRRQGEWFFIPVSGLVVDPKWVLHNEPIRRGGGKPHLVEDLYRTGGTRVYVCSRHPNGLIEPDYKALLRRNPAASRWGWRVMVRDAGVYARGHIRHRDHATITLPDWHRVTMNTETQSRTMQNVAFLD